MLCVPVAVCAEWHEELGLSQTYVYAPVFKSDMRVYLSPAKREHFPSITLIHGVGGSAQDFTDLIPMLKAHFNLIVVDLPGYGESNESSELYSAANYAINLSVILPKLVSSTNYVIGHSMGGNISLQMSAYSPELVTKLVLIDPAGMLNKFSYSKYIALNQANEVPFVSDKSKTRFSRIIDSINNYIPDFSDLLLSEPSRKYLFKNNTTYISAISVMDEDLTKILRLVNTPTLILWGKADPVMPYQTGFMLDSVLANSSLELIPEVGHSPQREEPGKVYSLIENFLSKSASMSTLSPRHTPRPEKQNTFELDCNKSANKLANNAYEQVSILNCDNLTIDNLNVSSLKIENSKVSLNYLNIENVQGFAITAINSNVTVWGGNITAESGAELTTTFMDINGVNIKTINTLFVTDEESQILASVSTAENNGIVGSLHGFVVEQGK